MIVYVLLFSIALALYVRSEEYCKETMLIALLLATCLIIGLRNSGVDRDYYVYRDNYIPEVRLLQEYLAGAPFQHEPGFNVIASLVTKHLGLGYQWIFIIFAFLGVSIKVEAFRQVAPGYFFAALLIHFGNTLFLHDFTQIRVSIGIAFFLISLPDVFNRKLSLFLLKIALASIFHYSLVITLPLYFVYGFIIGKRWILGVLLAAMVLAIATSGYWIPPLCELVPRLYCYFNVGRINYANPLVIMRLGVLAIVFINPDARAALGVKEWFYVSVYLLGIGIFYFFHTSAGIGLRLSQVYFAIDPIAIPSLFKGFRKGTRFGLVTGIAMALLLANLYYIKIVNPYSISFNNLW